MSDITERLHGPDGMEAGHEILRLREENARLRVALISLITTMDDFWNDKTLPSIAHMNEQTVRSVEAAQRTAAAILKGEKGMSDIVERLYIFAESFKRCFGVNHESILLNDARAEILRLREENARLREENDAWQMDGGSCAEEVKRLREENARLRETLQYIADPYRTTSKDRLAFLARAAIREEGKEG